MNSSGGWGWIEEIGGAGKPEPGLRGFNEGFVGREWIGVAGAEDDSASVADESLSGRGWVFGKNQIRGVGQLDGVHAKEHLLRSSLHEVAAEHFDQFAHCHQSLLSTAPA